MDIEIPSEFKKMCRNLVQGLDVETPDELVQHALVGIDREDASAIRKFLDELLSKNYKAEELHSFWWSLPSDIVFDKGDGVEAFLKLVRVTLSKPPYQDAAEIGTGG
jgi:hypothetical protein